MHQHARYVRRTRAGTTSLHVAPRGARCAVRAYLPAFDVAPRAPAHRPATSQPAPCLPLARGPRSLAHPAHRPHTLPSPGPCAFPGCRARAPRCLPGGRAGGRRMQPQRRAPGAAERGRRRRQPRCARRRGGRHRHGAPQPLRAGAAPARSRAGRLGQRAGAALLSGSCALAHSRGLTFAGATQASEPRQRRARPTVPRRPAQSYVRQSAGRRWQCAERNAACVFDNRLFAHSCEREQPRAWLWLHACSNSR